MAGSDVMGRVRSQVHGRFGVLRPASEDLLVGVDHSRSKRAKHIARASGAKLGFSVASEVKRLSDAQVVRENCVWHSCGKNTVSRHTASRDRGGHK